MTPLRLAFAGTPAMAAEILARVADGPHHVVGVLSQPDRPSGRGRTLKPTPVKQVALQRGLPVAQPERLDQTGRAQLAEWAPDLLVVVAYGLLLPRAALALPRLGCINVHASLLPRWRGAAPVERAIMAGDAETGVGIMQMERGLDTGPVYLEQRCPITPDSTGDSLLATLTDLGADALALVLDQLANGTAVATAQAPDGVTYAHKLAMADAELDWQQDAEALARQVRALYSRLPAWTWLPGGQRPERMKVLAASAATDLPAGSNGHRRNASPGTVLQADRQGLLVACAGGALRLTRVQVPRGKGRPLPVADLLNGYPDLVSPGTRLGAAPVQQAGSA